MLRAALLSLLLATLVPVGEAHAQDVETGTGLAAPLPLSATTSEPEPPASPADDPADVRYTDASANRVVWLPSGETQPSGTFYTALYELVGLQLGYAVSDRIEISLVGVPPFDNFPYAYELSCKANVFRADLLRVALLGSLGVFVSEDREVAVGGRVAAMAQLCLTKHCRSYATLAFGVLVTDLIDRALPFGLGLGFVFRLHDLVALVVEPVFGRIQQSDAREVFVLNYGVRIGTAMWSLDVGLTRPFIDYDEALPAVAGFPWLAFTMRFGYEPDASQGLDRTEPNR